jgi:hypothetical protein
MFRPSAYPRRPSPSRSASRFGLPFSSDAGESQPIRYVLPVGGAWRSPTAKTPRPRGQHDDAESQLADETDEGNGCPGALEDDEWHEGDQVRRVAGEARPDDVQTKVWPLIRPQHSREIQEEGNQKQGDTD